MRHAQNNLVDAQGTTALDDLFERRHHGFTAVQTETLGAGIFDIDEFFEAFGLYQFIQNGLAALFGESDFFVLSFDALLYPRLFGRIGNMHEFPAQRRAIGPLQDALHLADGGIFKTQNMIDENLAIPIRFGEAKSCRMQFGRIFGRADIERIKLRIQMAAHAIGADHHQSAHAVARGLLDIGIGHRSTLGCPFGVCLAFEFVGDDFFNRAPIAVKGRDQFAIGGNRPVLALPRRAFGTFLDGLRIIIQGAEKGLPFGIHRMGVCLITSIEIFNIRGIRAIQKRRLQKAFVLVLSSHGVYPSLFQRIINNEKPDPSGGIPCAPRLLSGSFKAKWWKLCG